ncbi:NAD-dependent epimerase/dehydratase family protein [Fusibacter ferrireducens]|uniref:NAD-dependent epimerase/dehydratase family protein n=1 Tax=Fusibacter ferrireducens TaxID=2785058 RepID=A0ABR9ZX73_9FIRM|nr:NAD-dependent epimerase/dehydratase family protein [Fusibacter ferrireducens]MBF4694204.1 NAD-dependent epimerase/dehydratase family protein [Fusibacter ferrireducens]
MKVLITGGYGFIGSHVADKFHREGHSIFIIDNLTSGLKSNFIHKHRFYELNVEDPKCEEVFESNSFDIVIHMAAQNDETYSQKYSYHDTKINVLGLMNMLSLSTKYKVKKFIFASSASVYGDDTDFPCTESSPKKPVSVLGTNKLLGEYYCSQWRNLNQIETISLRISNVYGPRQVATSGVVSAFFDKQNKGKGITVYGDGEQLRDFVYVEDVADAFYKAANIKYSGVLNLSAGMSTSINHLIQLIEKYGEFKFVQHLEAKPNEVKKSQLDNALITRILDWIPVTSLEEGIEKTHNYFVHVASQKHENEAVEPGKTKKGFENLLKILFKHNERKWLPYVENAIAFFILTLFSIKNAQMFTKLPVDLNLLLIIIFSIVYGSRQGIFAFAFSFISMIAVFIATNRDPMVLMYSTDFYIVLAFYVFVAFIIGYIKDNLVRENADKYETIHILNEKIDFITNLYHDMRSVRDELQSQIVNSEDSFGKIFSIIQELDTLKPEEVFAKAITVLEKLMKTQGVAIYRFSETSKYARLMACSSGMNDTIVKSIKIEDYSEIVSVIVKKDLYVSRELAVGRPIMVMPVFDHTKIVGSILIYKTDFERLTLSYQNYFRVITDLVSSTLSKAYAYDAAIESDKYIQGTNILRPVIFNEMIESKKSLKKKHQLNYVLLRILLNEISQLHAAEKVGSIIRDTDFMGIDQESNFSLVLGNTNEKEAEFVIERLAKLGLKAELCEEVTADE